MFAHPRLPLMFSPWRRLCFLVDSPTQMAVTHAPRTSSDVMWCSTRTHQSLGNNNMHNIFTHFIQWTWMFEWPKIPANYCHNHPTVDHRHDHDVILIYFVPEKKRIHVNDNLWYFPKSHFPSSILILWWGALANEVGQWLCRALLCWGSSAVPREAESCCSPWLGPGVFRVCTGEAGVPHGRTNSFHVAPWLRMSHLKFVYWAIEHKMICFIKHVPNQTKKQTKGDVPRQSRWNQSCRMEEVCPDRNLVLILDHVLPTLDNDKQIYEFNPNASKTNIYYSISVEGNES